MAIEVRVKMLRAVGGFEVGAFRTLRAQDAERLEARGVIEIVSKPSRTAPKRPAKKKRGSKSAGASPRNKKAPALSNKGEPQK